MILMELPNALDLMTLITLGQSQYKMFNTELPFDEKMKISDKMTIIGAVFCGTVIHINEKTNNEYKMSSTIATINEPGFRDGVYCYVLKNPPPMVPEPDSRIEDGYSFYGSYDINEPFVEIWFGETLVCKIETVASSDRYIAHPVMCEKSMVPEDVYNMVNEGILTSITQLNLTTLAGYKAGLNEFMGGNE